MGQFSSWTTEGHFLFAAKRQKKEGAYGRHQQRLKDRPPLNRRIISTLVEEQDGYCFLCGKELVMPNMNIDHIVPKSKGGTNRKQNLAAVCCECNRNKGNMSLEEYDRKFNKK